MTPPEDLGPNVPFPVGCCDNSLRYYAARRLTQSRRGGWDVWGQGPRSKLRCVLRGRGTLLPQAALIVTTRVSGLKASFPSTCSYSSFVLLPFPLLVSPNPPLCSSTKLQVIQENTLIMSLTVDLKTPATGSYKQPIGLYINGEWVEGADKKKFETINPSTEEVITSVCEATEKDVDIAAKAARAAFEGEWSQVTPHDRGKLLWKLSDLVEKNIELLAAVESLDNGKSLTMAKGDLGAVLKTLRYYAGWADKIEGKTIDVAPDMFHYTRSEPVSSCMDLVSTP